MEWTAMAVVMIHMVTTMAAPMEWTAMAVVMIHMAMTMAAPTEVMEEAMTHMITTLAILTVSLMIPIVATALVAHMALGLVMIVGSYTEIWLVMPIQQVENHGGIVTDQAHVIAPLELLISAPTAMHTTLTSISPLVIMQIAQKSHATETFDSH